MIRSCAKLDYATAQRMVEGVIPTVDSQSASEAAWNEERRPDPVSGHTCDSVVADVLALHTIASARRKRRFSHAGGALKLTRPKLTFTLDAEGQPEKMGVCVFAWRSRVAHSLPLFVSSTHPSRFQWRWTHTTRCARTRMHATACCVRRVLSALPLANPSQIRAEGVEPGEFIYRYTLCESCSRFDLPPLIYYNLKHHH